MKEFRLGGQQFKYFYHPHNCGASDANRRTERTVELPVARFWVDAAMRCSGGPVVEIGAVTPYYWPGLMSRVYDPADRRSTHKLSMFDCSFLGGDVLSISTIEHIGESRYGLREQKTPLDAWQKIHTEASLYLFTFPFGARQDKPFLDFQSAMLDRPQGTNIYTLTRQADETWGSGQPHLPYGNAKKPWANTVVFVERGGLLE